MLIIIGLTIVVIIIGLLVLFLIDKYSTNDFEIDDWEDWWR